MFTEKYHSSETERNIKDQIVVVKIKKIPDENFPAE